MKMGSYPQINNNLWITLCKFIMVTYLNLWITMLDEV